MMRRAPMFGRKPVSKKTVGKTPTSPPRVKKKSRARGTICSFSSSAPAAPVARKMRSTTRRRGQSAALATARTASSPCRGGRSMPFISLGVTGFAAAGAAERGAVLPSAFAAVEPEAPGAGPESLGRAGGSWPALALRPRGRGRRRCLGDRVAWKAASRRTNAALPIAHGRISARSCRDPRAQRKLSQPKSMRSNRLRRSRGPCVRHDEARTVIRARGSSPLVVARTMLPGACALSSPYLLPSLPPSRPDAVTTRASRRPTAAGAEPAPADSMSSWSGRSAHELRRRASRTRGSARRARRPAPSRCDGYAARRPSTRGFHQRTRS